MKYEFKLLSANEIRPLNQHTWGFSGFLVQLQRELYDIAYKVTDDSLGDGDNHLILIKHPIQQQRYLACKYYNKDTPPCWYIMSIYDDNGNETDPQFKDGNSYTVYNPEYTHNIDGRVGSIQGTSKCTLSGWLNSIYLRFRDTRCSDEVYNAYYDYRCADIELIQWTLADAWLTDEYNLNENSNL